ncbi:flavodoxin [Candidatus Fermentibacteria bacterium]|nr:MAG: flavodoxin [Candidatus Fermentibacteria bacterium]
MKKTAVIYGSTTGNTEMLAQKIQGRLKGSELKEVSSMPVSEMSSYEVLLLGSSTWGLGDLQDDWEGMADQLSGLDLKGVKVGFFGTGDQSSYSDTFVDAIGILKEKLQNTGAEFIGSISTDGYTYDASRAEENGKLIGLAVDEDNQPDMTDQRLDSWLESMKDALN